MGGCNEIATSAAFSKMHPQNFIKKLACIACEKQPQGPWCNQTEMGAADHS